jgi:hypothetical protein
MDSARRMNLGKYEHAGITLTPHPKDGSNGTLMGPRRCGKQKVLQIYYGAPGRGRRQIYSHIGENVDLRLRCHEIIRHNLEVSLGYIVDHSPLSSTFLTSGSYITS